MNNWSAQKFARHRVFFLFFVWSFYLPLWNFLTTQIDYIQDSELLSKRAHKNLKCLVIFPIEITTCTCWFRYFAYTPMCRLQKHVFFKPVNRIINLNIPHTQQRIWKIGGIVRQIRKPSWKLNRELSDNNWSGAG